MAMRCEEIMKSDPARVGPKDAVIIAADRMRRSNVGFLPVCDGEGRVVGTITDRDIAIRLVAEDLPAKTRVEHVMTRDVVACRPDDAIGFAETLMAQHRKSRVMCTDAAGHLLGVLSLSDIVRWEEPGPAARLMQQISSREAHA